MDLFQWTLSCSPSAWFCPLQPPSLKLVRGLSPTHDQMKSVKMCMCELCTSFFAFTSNCKNPIPLANSVWCAVSPYASAELLIKLVTAWTDTWGTYNTEGPGTKSRQQLGLMTLKAPSAKSSQWLGSSSKELWKTMMNIQELPPLVIGRVPQPAGSKWPEEHRTRKELTPLAAKQWKRH